MSRPTARVLALLELLQAGGTRTVGELAERLGVDERTVRRYVSHLTDLDVPVESVRGRYGGYRLAPGFRMPPLMLNDEEALAVVLGLVAGGRAGLLTTSAEATASAVAKLFRVLPLTLGARLDAVLETTDFTAPAVPAEGPPASRALLDLARAVREHREAGIGYRDRNGQHTRRTVRPYGVVAHNGRWYLVAADPADGQVRGFRLDRISQVTLRQGDFEPPAGFDAAAFLLANLPRTPWRHEVTVRVQGSADEVRTRLPQDLATIEPIDDGWVRVVLRAERLDWVPRTLAALDLPFVVDGPAELRALLRDLASRLLAAAADP